MHIIHEHICVCVCMSVLSNIQVDRRSPSQISSPAHHTALPREHVHTINVTHFSQTCLFIYMTADLDYVVSCHACAGVICTLPYIRQTSLCQYLPHLFKCCIIFHDSDIPMNGCFRSFWIFLHTRLQNTPLYATLWANSQVFTWVRWSTHIESFDCLCHMPVLRIGYTLHATKNFPHPTNTEYFELPKFLSVWYQENSWLVIFSSLNISQVCDF